MNIDSINQFSGFNTQTSFNNSDFWLQNFLAAGHQPAYQEASHILANTSNVDKQKVMELSDSISVSVIDPTKDFQIKKRLVKSARRKSPSNHRTAERARREKINHKFKRLQELIPGCYKTMGMSAMLEEIINYVQALQNQVEFLSMELAAASSFYDFNNEKGTVRNLQGTSTHDMPEIERLMSKGYDGEGLFFC